MGHGSGLQTEDLRPDHRDPLRPGGQRLPWEREQPRRKPGMPQQAAARGPDAKRARPASSRAAPRRPLPTFSLHPGRAAAERAVAGMEPAVRTMAAWCVARQSARPRTAVGGRNPDHIRRMLNINRRRRRARHHRHGDDRGDGGLDRLRRDPHGGHGLNEGSNGGGRLDLRRSGLRLGELLVALQQRHQRAIRKAGLAQHQDVIRARRETGGGIFYVAHHDLLADTRLGQLFHARQRWGKLWSHRGLEAFEQRVRWR